MPIVETRTVDVYVFAKDFADAERQGRILADAEAYTAHTTNVPQLDYASIDAEGIYAYGDKALNSPSYLPERENADENEWNLANLNDE